MTATETIKKKNRKKKKLISNTIIVFNHRGSQERSGCPQPLRTHRGSQGGRCQLDCCSRGRTLCLFPGSLLWCHLGCRLCRGSTPGWQNIEFPPQGLLPRLPSRSRCCR